MQLRIEEFIRIAESIDAKEEGEPTILSEFARVSAPAAIITSCT
jgi:hypothetical protein